VQIVCKKAAGGLLAGGFGLLPAASAPAGTGAAGSGAGAWGNASAGGASSGGAVSGGAGTSAYGPLVGPAGPGLMAPFTLSGPPSLALTPLPPGVTLSPTGPCCGPEQQNVPEPASVLLLLPLALVIWATTRRRR